MKINYETADDNRLLSGLKEGNREAFSCIYIRYHAMLFTFAAHYLKSRPEAEDVVQQIFIKLWTIREAVFITSNLKGYLFAMTKHLVMNRIRNANSALRHNYRIVQQQPQSDDDLYMYAERHHLTEELQSAIRRLPPQQQTVATLRCEGFSNQEIAQRLNLSVYTVNTHYRECLKTLKTYFGRGAKMILVYLFFNL